MGQAGGISVGDLKGFGVGYSVRRNVGLIRLRIGYVVGYTDGLGVGEVIEDWLVTRTEWGLVKMFNNLDMRTGLELPDVTAAQLE